MVAQNNVPTDDTTLDEPLLEQFEAYSRTADWIATVGVMGYAFGSVTDWKSYLPDPADRLSPEAWIAAVTIFFHENGWAPVLAMVAIGAYIAGRVFARKNIGHLRSLFADENTPTGFQIITRGKLFLIIFGQLVTILAMVWYCREIIYPCLGWILLHLIFLHSNAEQRFWMKRVMDDKLYVPRSDHPHSEFIAQRRVEAARYLARPHDYREYMVIGCALLAISFDRAQAWRNFPYGNSIAYITMLAGVVLNEIVVGVWRLELERGLKKANIAQLLSDRRRDL